jgi:hypothetical protein
VQPFPSGSSGGRGLEVGQVVAESTLLSGAESSGPREPVLVRDPFTGPLVGQPPWLCSGPAAAAKGDRHGALSAGNLKAIIKLWTRLSASSHHRL